MRYLLIFSLILILLSFSGCECGKSSDPEPVDETFYMNLMPEASAIGPGENITLTGSINSVEGLFAVTFDLVFDSTILSYESLTIPQTGLLGNSVLSFSNTISGGVSVSLGRIQTEANDNVSGNGVLFEITFSAAGTGTTNIQYQNIFIIDEQGVENSDINNLILNNAEVVVR